jgi:hypothetical protein
MEFEVTRHITGADVRYKTDVLDRLDKIVPKQNRQRQDVLQRKPLEVLYALREEIERCHAEATLKVHETAEENQRAYEWLVEALRKTFGEKHKVYKYFRNRPPECAHPTGFVRPLRHWTEWVAVTKAIKVAEEREAKKGNAMTVDEKVKTLVAQGKVPGVDFKLEEITQ